MVDVEASGTIAIAGKESTQEMPVRGVMVGVACWITTLEFHPVLTVSAQVFTALYGLGLIFMLWGSLLGWLMSLREADDGS